MTDYKLRQMFRMVEPERFHRRETHSDGGVLRRRRDRVERFDGTKVQRSEAPSVQQTQSHKFN